MPRDTTTHRGIPITTIAKTLLDLAASSPKNHLEHAIGQAMRNELYDHAARSTDVLAPPPRPPRHQSATQATAEDPAFTRSALEQRFRAALPPRRPAAAAEQSRAVAAADHHPHEVDFYFPTHRLVVETDGWRDHGTRIAFERDRAKDAALVAAGHIVLRFTKRQIAEDPTPSPRASERDVPVLSLRRLHALGEQRLERGDDLRARLVGDDHVVDVAALGRACRGWRSAPCSRR